VPGESGPFLEAAGHDLFDYMGHNSCELLHRLMDRYVSGVAVEKGFQVLEEVGYKPPLTELIGNSFARYCFIYRDLSLILAF
jgi:hypothetical protein